MIWLRSMHRRHTPITAIAIGLWEPPTGLSLGAVIFGDQVHRLHDGRHFAHVAIAHMHGSAGHRVAHGSTSGARHG
jgi:hypothetical protein